MNKNIVTGILGAALLFGNGSTYAVEQGDWLVRIGATMVSPDASSSGVVADDAVDVDDGTSVSVDFTYMLREHIGIELLAAYPFTHDITLEGIGKIAEVDHLPPTLSVQYHFWPKSNLRPYVGAGLNYTTFFNEEATAVINDISLDDSFGLAAQAGLDFDINEKWYVNAVLRYINIDTTAKTNLGDIDVDINPWVYTLGVGTSF